MFTVKRKYTLEKLSRDIHMKREEMIQLGLTSGLNSRRQFKLVKNWTSLFYNISVIKKTNTEMVFNYKIPIFQIGYEGKSNNFGECLSLVL